MSSHRRLLTLLLIAFSQSIFAFDQSARFELGATQGYFGGKQVKGDATGLSFRVGGALPKAPTASYYSLLNFELNILSNDQKTTNNFYNEGDENSLTMNRFKIGFGWALSDSFLIATHMGLGALLVENERNIRTYGVTSIDLTGYWDFGESFGAFFTVDYVLPIYEKYNEVEQNIYPSLASIGLTYRLKAE